MAPQRGGGGGFLKKNHLRAREEPERMGSHWRPPLRECTLNLKCERFIRHKSRLGHEAQQKRSRQRWDEKKGFRGITKRGVTIH